MTITVTATTKPPVQVSLVGKNYKVTPVSGTVAMKLGAIGADLQKLGKQKQPDEDKLIAKIGEMNKLIDGLLVKLFGPSTAKKVQARLDDPLDDLEFEHIMELVQKMNSEESDDPTT